MRTLSKNFLRKITLARAAVSVTKFHLPKLPEPLPLFHSEWPKLIYECNRVKTVGGIANSSDPLIWVPWPKLFTSAIGLKQSVELQIV